MSITPSSPAEDVSPLSYYRAAHRSVLADSLPDLDFSDRILKQMSFLPPKPDGEVRAEPARARLKYLGEAATHGGDHLAELVFDVVPNPPFLAYLKQAVEASFLLAHCGYINLWSLFVRLLEPDRHVEVAGSRRWFLVIAARLVESGCQKTLQVSVQGRWWEQLKVGYTRVAQWLASTAPQLKIPPPLPTQIAFAPA